MIYRREAVAFIGVQSNAFEPESYPVEVAACRQDQLSRSFIVHPAPNWAVPANPDLSSMAHGISWNEACAKGLPPAFVAGSLNEALAGLRVYSEHAEWVSYWLNRLHRAAGLPRTYLVADWRELVEAALPAKRAWAAADWAATTFAPRKDEPADWRADAQAKRLAAGWDGVVRSLAPAPVAA